MSNKKKKTRSFSLNANEILELIDADSSGGEEEDVLDDEDLEFLEDDILEGRHNTIIVTTKTTSNAHNEPENDANNLSDVDMFEDEECPEIVWKRQSVPPRNVEPVTGFDYGGITLSQEVQDDPDMFKVFSEVSQLDDLIKLIKVQSELYMHQKGRVFSVSHEELKAFLGMVIRMSYHQVPKISDYWSTESDLRVPCVADVMPRDRFMEIRNALHFSDNMKALPRGHENHDRAGKVRPIIEHFNSSFMKAMQPTRKQSIDEKMIKVH